MRNAYISKWYLHLRWFSFAGQLAVLWLATYFGLTLPLSTILLILTVIPVTNILAYRFIHSFSRSTSLGLILTLDTLILTAVLGQAGGPSNPFTIVYLLHLVLAAVMLTPSWTWFIAVLSSISFASLFIISRPVPEWEMHGAHHGFSLHLHGMLFAYMTVSFLAAYFLNKILKELRDKESRLNRLKAIEENQKRLAALATITAGAAHELGSPLGTIAVVAAEMERRITASGNDHVLQEDIKLLKSEVQRCKEVLRELAERTGDRTGEPLQVLSISELLEAATQPLITRAEFDLSGVKDERVRVPPKALLAAIKNILANAVESYEGMRGIVRVATVTSERQMLLEISDEGCGIAESALERIGEPFFSTKDPGRGLGLGIYLARLTLEQIGGSLNISSIPGRGTSVKMVILRDCLKGQLAA
ncbi:MAG: HAMP domain-containing histidine kinase [Deltaproteobacteria bacterium]|nr:HAMP domain-containing histidine kinase [Deltaproteobacteria bacterium]